MGVTCDVCGTRYMAGGWCKCPLPEGTRIAALERQVGELARRVVKLEAQQELEAWGPPADVCHAARCRCKDCLERYRDDLQRLDRLRARIKGDD